MGTPLSREGSGNQTWCVTLAGGQLHWLSHPIGLSWFRLFVSTCDFCLLGYCYLCARAGILISLKHVKCLVPNQEPASLGQAPTNSSFFPGISKMKDITRKQFRLISTRIFLEEAYKVSQELLFCLFF